MRYLFLLIFVVIFFYSQAQIRDSVKIVVDQISSSDYSSSSQFASILNHKFKDKIDKAGAVYYWIATHLELDTKDYFSDKKQYIYNFRYRTTEEKDWKIQKVNMDLAEEAFKTKRANYLGYVMLFKKLCDNVGLECEVVEGSFLNTMENIGKDPVYVNFMWNVFRVKEKWYLVDILSGSGVVNEHTNTFTAKYRELFFMTDPDVFFLSHYPKNKKWLLTDKSAEDFKALPLFYPGYYDKLYVLQKPERGEITDVKNGKIEVCFKCKDELINPVKIRYSLYSEQLPRMPKSIKGLSFEIPVKEVKRDYITVSINDKPVFSCKLNLTDERH